MCPFFFFFLPLPKLGNLGNILEDVLGVEVVGGGGGDAFTWLRGSSCSSMGGSAGGVGKPQDLLRRCPFLGVEEVGVEELGASSELASCVGSCGTFNSRLGI